MSIFRAQGMTVCAELGPNHCGDLGRALRLIGHAKAAGADCAKIQVFEPDDLTRANLHSAYTLTDSGWAGRNLWNLYLEAQTPYAWLPDLFVHARDVVGIPLFASVFSVRGLGALEAVGCPAYKIASAEVADTRFVERVASAGKPVILSDGMATPSQMGAAMQAVPYDRLTVLKCVSEYPAPASAYNLATLRVLNHDGIACGVSDHTTGKTVPVMAATLGASMLEKHLMATDCMSVRPLDYDHSLAPLEFASMVDAVREAEAALGSVVLGASIGAGRGWRRRLVAARDLPAGHVLALDDVTTARCGDGMEPDAFYIGRTLNRALQEGEPVTEAATARAAA